MSRYDIVRNLFAPKRKAYAALYNPAAPGSLIGSGIVRKTFSANAWALGANTLLTANGHVRIESFFAIVTAGFTSGGAATLSIGTVGDSGYFTVGGSVILGALTLNAIFGINNGAVQVTAGINGQSDPTSGGENRTPPAIASTINRGHLNLRNGGVIIASVGTAVYTGGTLDLIIIYTPLSAGATLT